MAESLEGAPATAAGTGASPDDRLTDQSGASRITSVGAMRLMRGGRPLKRWRYVGVFGEELMACAALVQVGPARQAFWALYERGEDRLRHVVGVDELLEIEGVGVLPGGGTPVTRPEVAWSFHGTQR